MRYAQAKVPHRIYVYAAREFLTVIIVLAFIPLPLKIPIPVVYQAESPFGKQSPVGHQSHVTAVGDIRKRRYIRSSPVITIELSIVSTDVVRKRSPAENGS